jgi:uncharacterized protein YciI
MRFFILNYSRGPNWAEGQPRHQQPLGPHLAYLRGLHEKSQLVMTGPLAEAAGGIAIIQTSSADEAQAIAQADPGVLAGTLRVEVSEWRPIVWDPLMVVPVPGSLPPERNSKGTEIQKGRRKFNRDAARIEGERLTAQK